MEQVEAELERLRNGEIEATERIASKLAQLKGAVRKLRQTHSLRIEHLRAQEAIERAAQIAAQFNDRLDQASVDDLRAEEARAFQLHDERRMRILRERAEEIFWRHYFTTPESWENVVDYLRENRAQATDRVRYHDSLYRAEECLRNNDFEGVQLHATDAFAYLPAVFRDRAKQLGSGLRLA